MNKFQNNHSGAACYHLHMQTCLYRALEYDESQDTISLSLFIIMVNAVRVSAVQKTNPVSAISAMASPPVDESKKQVMVNALRKMIPAPQGKEILKKLHMNTYSQPDPSLYNKAVQARQAPVSKWN